MENAIRSLAIGRKNYLFCGSHDAAVCAAIVYSLFSSCKAHGIDTRTWLEDILKRLPSEKEVTWTFWVIKWVEKIKGGHLG